MWRWLTNPANGPEIGAIGLIISVVGFAFTLIQLWRTKRSADAASKAANAARIRINSFNALRECESAKHQARKISDAISRSDWQDVIAQYQPLASNIHSLIQSNIDLDDEVIESLNRATDIVDRNCSVIERALNTNSIRLSKGKQFAALRPLDSIIAKAFFNIERIG